MNALYLIQQAGQLMLMPRAHKRNLGTSYDTIASHTFHVSFIALVLAKMEWLSDADAYKASTMALLHDLAEARTGDHDFIAKNYNKCDEMKAIDDQFKDLGFANPFHDLLDEYEERSSVIARIVKDADNLAQFFHERVLMLQGNKLAEQRYTIDKTKRGVSLFTQSAKIIADKMDDSNPNERWRTEFVENNFSQKNLTGTD